MVKQLNPQLFVHHSNVIYSMHSWLSLEPRNYGALLVPKYALTYLSDHNWKYYSLFGEGAIRKRFLRVERFHRGCFFRHEKLVHSVLGSDQL